MKTSLGDLIVATILVFIVYFLMGCSASNIQTMIDGIPTHEFESIEYTRVTGPSSATITAHGGQKDSTGQIVVEDLTIVENFSFGGISFTAKGLKIEGRSSDGIPVSGIRDALNPDKQ
jgi:hypothetical protein